MNQTSRPSIAASTTFTRPSAVRLLDQVIANTSFDADMYHVMNERDNSLVADEILNGSGSSKFVYVMEGMKGEDGNSVSGISVIGARHLASFYGGIEHRIVATVRKVGSQFITTSYPAPGIPMETRVEMIHALADEPDSYTAIVEIKDKKTGNSIMAEKREERFGRKRDGGRFERPNYDIIAQSKAFRNGVLSVLPQDVIIRWKIEMLKLDKHKDVITDSVRDEKIAGVTSYAAKKGIPIDRIALADLAMPQIAGLSDAARASDAAFTNALIALGLVQAEQSEPEPAPPKSKAEPKGRAKSAAPSEEAPPFDPQTGEIERHAAKVQERIERETAPPSDPDDLF